MITFKNKKSKNWYDWCINEVKGIACLAMALFLALSLYTYNAYDECFFYFSSAPQPIANWCGYLGAQVSSFLIYFFGISSYAIALFFSFLAYIYCAQKPLINHWERVIAGGF
ncbi:hypothetical protein Noda2021_05860 [Candidatus Dependentiae bacterium Noda2021]|nr:hypothetical protein Noda2021_05860 [Candidatus Dependentiae bacterium Noda2021]